ncbi:hypothetical protein RQP46_000972 [Phenoliferia psychrophenolica]
MLARRLQAAALIAPPSCRALRRAVAPSARAFLPRTRSLATTTSTPLEPPHTLAVVGGGLSGLSSAFYFLNALSPAARQAAKVVLLEKETRFGGWCKSVPIPTKEDAATIKDRKDAALIFETGPRSIRPVGLQGWLTVELAHSLGLTPLLLTVPKSHPSAKNRYVYHPTSLTLLPSSLPTALSAAFTKPIIRSALPGILLEPFRPRSPLHDLPDGGDESVDSFFSRRFGVPLAENMISAMIHGIYSGDTRGLSMRAVFPGLWEAEREWGSVVRAGLFSGVARKYGKKGRKESPYRIEVGKQEEEMGRIKERLRGVEGGDELVKRMEGASVWGVKGGLETITDALRNWLVEQGVEVRSGSAGDVTAVEHINGHWTVATPTSTLSATHLITSNPLVLPSSLRPPPTPSTTVSVINLAFPLTTPALFPSGFGYLIPRSVVPSQNPHHALGVIFDSDVMPSLDSSSSNPNLALSKVSMLLGGAYWLPKGPPNPLPNNDTLVGWAMDTLRLHFPKTTFPEPTFTLTHTHKECIPQVPVGYENYLSTRIPLF